MKGFFDSAKVFELLPVDSRKSFYGKAQCIELDGAYFLQSYGTIVASIDSNGVFHRHWDGYSLTTGRHLDSFLEYCGKRRISKKEWESLEVE